MRAISAGAERERGRAGTSYQERHETAPWRRINTLNYVKITADRKSRRYHAAVGNLLVTRRFFLSLLERAAGKGPRALRDPSADTRYVWSAVIIPNVRRLLAAYRTIDGDAGNWNTPRGASPIETRTAVLPAFGARQAGQLWIVTADRQQSKENERTNEHLTYTDERGRVNPFVFSRKPQVISTSRFTSITKMPIAVLVFVDRVKNPREVYLL